MSNTQFSQQLQNWQRLSPISIIFFIGKFIAHLIKDALPSMAPLAVVIFSSDNKSWMVMAIGIGVVGLVLISSSLQYWFFKFKQDENKVLINDGVFKKNHRVIQFDRIQNINILQPIYFKPFNLVTLQIETAGAKGNEADLAGIPKDFAEYLRNEILEQQKASTVNLDPDQQELEKPTETIAKASLKDLVKYGVSSNGVFWFFVFVAPVFGLSDELLKKWFTKEDFEHLAIYFGGGVTADVLIIVGMILTVIILMFSFSILGAIFRYFNYQLSLNLNQSNQQHNTLKRSSGLLTNYEESLKLQKVQTVITQSNFIGRWLKVINLTLGQVSTSQNNTKNKKSLFVIPARTSEQASDIQKIVFIDSPSEISTKGISRRYINKTIALKVFLPALLLCIPGFLISESYYVFIFPFVFSLVMLPLVIRRWKAYRFGMKDGYGRFERGLFGFRHITFPLYKVQRAEVRQSPIQRRKNLATLKIYLASNRIQMQYIPIAEANWWVDIIGQQVEKTKRAWY